MACNPSLPEPQPPYQVDSLNLPPGGAEGPDADTILLMGLGG